MSIPLPLLRHASRWALCFCLGLGASTDELRAQRSEPEAVRAVSGGLLEFLDGSVLHGSMASIDPASGLQWGHEASARPLRFKSKQLATIQFNTAATPPPEARPTARFYFRNGDEVLGNLESMTTSEVLVTSMFGGELHASRSGLGAVLLSSKGYRLLYEGPGGTEGWRTGRNPKSWQLKDLGFEAQAADLLGRDFGLKGSSVIEFDLAWSGTFSMSITLYAQVIDRFDYSTSAYVMYLGSAAISLQRVQAGAGASLLGQVQLPDFIRNRKARIEIRCNREEGTITLVIDGNVVQRWRDNAGWVANGSGLVFFSQVEPRGLRISNIRVAEWDGRFDAEMLSTAPKEMDVLLLANRDKVFGRIEKIEEGKIHVESRQTKLTVPIQRVNYIRFREDEPLPQPERAPWMVRASFPGGEGISFELSKWEGGVVTGKSPLFGDVTFGSSSVRSLRFNLDQPHPASADGAGLDEFFPGFE